MAEDRRSPVPALSLASARDQAKGSPARVLGSTITYIRLEQGLSQEDMARLTGIPLRTYLRIERGEATNPGIRYLTNIAIVLGLDPHDDGIKTVARYEWLEWHPFKGGPQEPPPFEEDPGRFEHPTTTWTNLASFFLVPTGCSPRSYGCRSRTGRWTPSDRRRPASANSGRSGTRGSGYGEW